MLDKTLKRRIMFGIYFVFLVRKLKRPLILESLSILTLTLVLTYLVSIRSVVENMLGSGSFSRYLFSAFSDTTFLIQAVLVLMIILSVLLMKNLASYSLPKLHTA